MKEAKYWKNVNGSVRCYLCPHQCLLKDGEWGICRNRKAAEGKLFSMVYGEPCAVNTDPVEKKPLYNFLPGSRTLSIGTAGCNLSCKNCQNHEISQAGSYQTSNYNLMPEHVVKLALEHSCDAIAYTYTEPATFAEYVYDTSVIAARHGLKNIMVSSGFINRQPLKDLCKVIDAANIDLKSFDDRVYRELNAGRLNTVLNTLNTMNEMGVWLEITFLIVPGWSDDLDKIRAMVKWMVQNDMKDVPLHFSRFFPTYQLTDLLPTQTEVMEKAWEIAREEGIKQVYLGNIPGSGKEHTFCPSCGRMVIQRNGFAVEEVLLKNGKCLHCGHLVPGVWK